jgi:protein involved in sex pheromone biosynthesis
MKRLLLAALPAVMLVLTACSGPVTGTVVDKQFSPSRCTTSVVTTKTTTSNGVKTTQKPKTTCSRDDYDLKVRGDDGKIRNVDTDRLTYETTRLGDRYPR